MNTRLELSSFFTAKSLLVGCVMSGRFRLEGTVLWVRSYREFDVEVAFIRKNLHEAGRLYDCLCDCHLGRGGEKRAEESGFAEHCEECLIDAFLARK